MSPRPDITYWCALRCTNNGIQAKLITKIDKIMFYYINCNSTIMFVLCYDILEYLFNSFDVVSQIRFRQIVFNIYADLQITDFFNIDVTIRKKLTDRILQIYPYIRRLDAMNNRKITTVNKFADLRELDASRWCGIDQAGISELRHLTKLSVVANARIYDVNHLTDLIQLDISYKYPRTLEIELSCEDDNDNNSENDSEYDMENHECDGINCRSKRSNCNLTGVGQSGICDLRNLLALYAEGNTKVTDVNHLIKLRELNISARCTVGQSGISELRNIIILDVGANSHVTSVNHLKYLRALNILECGVDQTGISEITDLVILCTCYNENITDVNHFTDLRELNIECSVIGQNGICRLHKLIMLDAAYSSITSVNHLPELTVLVAYKSLIDQVGISELRNIQQLYACDNSKITNVNHLTCLRELSITGSCGVDQEGITALRKLNILNSDDNEKIIDNTLPNELTDIPIAFMP